MITLGIDTSNYTTSVALYDGADCTMDRKILDVKSGMRGIRQSDGVFIHNRELPLMLEKILKNTDIEAVGVSTAPRNVTGSYMPVFTVGSGYGKAIAAATGLRWYEFSHQDGHIMAGIYSANAWDFINEPFISVHLSGGTTEVLRTEFDGYKFNNEIIGGTLDISAGQLIDRLGVKMGCKFPAGKAMEAMAQATHETVKLPFSIKGTYVNFSGVETMLMRNTDIAPEVVSRSLFLYIKDTLKNILSQATADTGIEKILVVGGVASNSLIRIGLIEAFGDNIRFATPELSSDNAVGIAVLAHLAKERE